MESIKHAGKYVSSKIQGGGAEASKEANKSVAKDSNVRVSTRLHAAKDAVGDKIDESRHNRNADVQHNAAKHNY